MKKETLKKIAKVAIGVAVGIKVVQFVKYFTEMVVITEYVLKKECLESGKPIKEIDRESVINRMKEYFEVKKHRFKEFE